MATGAQPAPGAAPVSAAATHQGKVRPDNEDAYLEAPEIGLWAVADGMGGLDAGEIASAKVIDALRTVPAEPDLDARMAEVARRLDDAHGAVRAMMDTGTVGSLGSTVAVLLIAGDAYTCLWAGDSRIYRLRGGGLQRVSHDHSYVQELVDSGTISADLAPFHPMRSIVTRCLGATDAFEPERRGGQVAPGDRFLLCSDGLTEMLPDVDIVEILTGRNAADAVAALIDATLDRGAVDNVTAVVVDAWPADQATTSS